MSDLAKLLAECNSDFLGSLEPLDVMKLIRPREEIPDVIGANFGGGIYIGIIGLNGKMYAVAVATKDEGEKKGAWGRPGVDVPGATHKEDGLCNTIAMAAAGSELAQWACDLRIGGFSDWHIPAESVLSMCYRVKNICSGLDFDDSFYWSSNQCATKGAWTQHFSGFIVGTDKSSEYLARAVRLVPI